MTISSRTPEGQPNRFKELLSQQLGISPAKRPSELNEQELKALGFDSLDAVELVILLEEELEIES